MLFQKRQTEVWIILCQQMLFFVVLWHRLDPIQRHTVSVEGLGIGVIFTFKSTHTPMKKTANNRKMMKIMVETRPMARYQFRLISILFCEIHESQETEIITIFSSLQRCCDLIVCSRIKKKSCLCLVRRRMIRRRMFKAMNVDTCELLIFLSCSLTQNFKIVIYVFPRSPLFFIRIL